MKLSIIIPAYNVQKTIKRCVDSILNQIKPFVEIIIINDGSTDQTDKIIRENYSDIENIRYYSQQNKGVSYTRNQGIKYSTGDYIWFVDSDDYIYENSIEYILDKIENNDMMLFDFSVNKIKNNIKFKEKLMSKKKFLKFLNKKLETTYISVPWNKIFKRKIINDNKIMFNNNLNSHEDYLFCLDYYKYVNKIIISNKIIYFYDTSGINTLSKKEKPTEYLWKSTKLLYYSIKNIYSNKKISNAFLLKRIYDIINFKYIYDSSNGLNKQLSIILNDDVVKEIFIDFSSYKTFASYLYIKNNDITFIKLINKIKKGIKR